MGVVFDYENNNDNNIEVIERNFPTINKSKIKTSKEEILQQVITGLEVVNGALGTNYKVSKIYFTLYDSSTCSVYSSLISKLIRHYHAGNEFRET